MNEQQRDRLAELRGKEAERQAKVQEEADGRELEALELVVTLEARGMKRGTDFEVVNNPIGGVFALKKPDTRAIRNWEQADEKKKLSLEWQIGLLRHYILDPDEKAEQGKRGIEWAQRCAALPGLCWQTSTAFIALMGVDTDAAAKK